jgi:hypothetical protein
MCFGQGVQSDGMVEVGPGSIVARKENEVMIEWVKGISVAGWEDYMALAH